VCVRFVRFVKYDNILLVKTKRTPTRTMMKETTKKHFWKHGSRHAHIRVQSSRGDTYSAFLSWTTFLLDPRTEARRSSQQAVSVLTIILPWQSGNHAPPLRRLSTHQRAVVIRQGIQKLLIGQTGTRVCWR